MRRVVDESTAVGHRPHQTERIDVAAAVILDGAQFAVDARILVGLIHGRVSTVLVALRHNAAGAPSVFRRARIILLNIMQTSLTSNAT